MNLSQATRLSIEGIAAVRAVLNGQVVWSASAPLPAAPNGGTVTSLADEATYLTALDSATDRVRLVPLGLSAQGRPIRAVVVGPPRSRDEIRAAGCHLVIGCHHGDEWAGREAIFEHMRDVAASNGTRTVVYLPTLNPDGFTIPDRELANGADPNREWTANGSDGQSDGGTYHLEQQALRQVILLFRPHLILDTHEYGASADSTSGTYRFDPGTINPAGTSTAVINASVAALNVLKTAATNAGYTVLDYTGSIPDDGMTQALKRGGVPSIFTESPQEATAGLPLRRAQQLNSMVALNDHVTANATELATIAGSATWYSGYVPSIADPYQPATPTAVQTILPVGATQSAGNGTSSSATITRPANTAPGDLLLAVVAGLTTAAPTAPSGWAIWEPTVTYGPNFLVVHRWATAGDPASWPWTVSSSSYSLTCTAWRGVDPTTPKDVASIQAGIETGFPSVPTVTPVTPGAVVLVIGGTVGPSGDVDVDWTTEGTEHAQATSQRTSATNSASIVTSRAVAAPGAVTPQLVPVETVARGGVLVSVLRPAAA